MWFDKVPHNPVKAVFTIHHLRLWCVGWATASCFNMLNMNAVDEHSALFFPWFHFFGVTLTSRQPTFTSECLLFYYQQSWRKHLFSPHVYQNRAGKLSHQQWRHSQGWVVCGWCAITDDAHTHTHTHTQPLLGGLCCICFVFLTQWW